MVRIRPATKYFGGKYYIAREIAQLFPPHNTYVETHGGMASVLLNKERAPVEIYNDIDLAVYNFFEQLRNNPEELQKSLTLTPYHEFEFNNYFITHDCGPGIRLEVAREFYIKLRLSQAGRGDAFSCTLHRSRRGMADVVSGYLSAIDEELPKIIERLRTVQILCQDAIDVIKKWDSQDTFFYCDPPYLQETRVSKQVYVHEMGEEKEDIDAQKLLLETLLNIKGKVMISGYNSPLYQRLLKDFRTHSFNMPNNAAGGKIKARKIETIWMNFSL